jgi:hypothetical protein
MMDEGVRVVAEVRFKAGVERIAYQGPIEVNVFDSREPRILVSFRPIVKLSCLTILPERLGCVGLLKNGVHFGHAGPLEKALPEMIRVLKEEGYITRHQEFEAYLAFEIPYSTEVKR